MDEHGSSSLLERKEHHILYKKLSDEILEYELKKKNQSNFDLDQNKK